MITGMCQSLKIWGGACSNATPSDLPKSGGGVHPHGSPFGTCLWYLKRPLILVFIEEEKPGNFYQIPEIYFFLFPTQGLGGRVVKALDC